jgi:alkyldihydroxyacetonephosphate synthase
MCHPPHSYHSGACLYFTFALTPSEERDSLAEYDVVKSAIQQTFVDSGATLSHHTRWARASHVAGAGHLGAGVAMSRALFDGVDGWQPQPGKLI